MMFPLLAHSSVTQQDSASCYQKQQINILFSHPIIILYPSWIREGDFRVKLTGPWMEMKILLQLVWLKKAFPKKIALLARLINTGTPSGD